MLGRHSASLFVACGLIALTLVSSTASAHDTGFNHSRRALLVTATQQEVQLEYRVTANAEEALIELALADTDANGSISAAERDRYFTKLGEELGSRLQCETSAGQRLPLTLVGFRLDQALTQTFTFRITSAAAELKLVDKNFAHKPGQVRIVAGSGVSVELLESVDLMHTERVPLKITRQSRP